MAMPSSRKSIRFASQLNEPAFKRQKMSSDTSTSTLSYETTITATTAQSVCLVGSEDLSSMVFHAADLQRVTNSWSTHHPLTGAEFEMKMSFKACENTANSLRSTLESLEVKAAKDHIACKWGDNTSDPHSTHEGSENRDDAEAIANRLKDSIMKTVEEEADPLADFESKVKVYFQQDVIERATSELKREIELQWRKSE
ncbi:unnamed protein product [Aureobasidium vineae]|uniref:Uncharacterized protein n=1 Tax=Aureobasidium vineae TaxID=2773715 RepID=A0A9N8PD53_9PEZI|nr:unnamed protein product [Aureobasidium vineae]